MAPPGETRPVRIVVIMLADLLGLLESLHDALCQPRVAVEQLVLESHHMHNRIKAVLTKVADLFLLGIRKEPRDLIGPSYHSLWRVGHHQSVDLPVLQHRADLFSRRDELNAHTFQGLEWQGLFLGYDPSDLAPGNAVLGLKIALGQHRESSLKGAEPDFSPDQIRRRPYPR